MTADRESFVVGHGLANDGTSNAVERFKNRLLAESNERPLNRSLNSKKDDMLLSD